MSDEVSFLEYGFKAAVGVILAVGGWMWAKLMTAVAQNKDDLSDHKLYVSENYAKKADLSPIYDTLKLIQFDIKTLLGRHRNDE